MPAKAGIQYSRARGPRRLLDFGSRSLRSLGRNDSGYTGSRYGSNASIEILMVGSASAPHSSRLVNTTV